MLRWEPQALRQATLDELQDAWQGYALHRGIDTAPPLTRAFMDMMVNTFGG